jgi:hypothetical protein
MSPARDERSDVTAMSLAEQLATFENHDGTTNTTRTNDVVAVEASWFPTIRSLRHPRTPGRLYGCTLTTTWKSPELFPKSPSLTPR